MTEFSTYTIFNREKNKIYIGQTKDLESRLKRHNSILPNEIKSYTAKNSGVWELIYCEKFKTRQEAIEREKELKSAKGRLFLRSIVK